jgi:hypothetical protein
MKTIPTNEELEDAGVIDIVSYYDQKIRKGNRHIFKTTSLSMNNQSSQETVIRKKEEEYKKGQMDGSKESTAERLSMLLLLAAARMKEVASTSALSKKRSARLGVNKKMSRIKFCYATNTFDLYSNLFDESAIIEEEEGGGKQPPSYHSKYITTILPGGIAPSAIRHHTTKSGESYASDGERGMRRGIKLKGLKGSRSPPRK